MDVPYGPWEPDRGEVSPGYTADAEGVIPHADGWGPMASLVVSGGADALPASPRGVYALTTDDGTWNVFAGTADSLYKMQNDYSFTQVDTGRAVTDGDDWSMTKFGAKLLYTNATDGMLAYDVEAGGAAVAIAAAKAPRQIFVCANQVVALDCLDNLGDRDNQLIRTSAFSDHTNWATNGADYQPLEDGGALVGGGAISETAAVIYQDRAIRLMDYGGAPDAGDGAYFALRLIASETGAIGVRSLAFADGRAFSIATDGFYMYTVSGGLVPIGSERINRWFLDTVDQSNLPLVQAALDPLRKIVWWRLKRAVDVSNTVSEIIIGYAWQLDRFVPPCLVQTSYLCKSATPGYTVDTADSLGLLDAIDTPLDSRFWQGGQPLFAALDGSFKFGTFAGGAMAATIQSATINNPVTGLVGWGTPIDDSAGATLALGTKDTLGADLVWGTAAAKNRGGAVPLRGRGMNIAFRRSFPLNDSWTYAKGIDHVKSSQGGPR